MSIRPLRDFVVEMTRLSDRQLDEPALFQEAKPLMADLIADPAWRGHSMTEIAFGWGFNSAPHFTRTFRDRFGIPPREYRRLKLEGEGGGFGAGPRARQAA